MAERGVCVVLGGELRDWSWSSASLDLDQQMSELCNRPLRTHRFQERKLDLKSFRRLLSLLRTSAILFSHISFLLVSCPSYFVPSLITLYFPEAIKATHLHAARTA